jgi:hypothetical protein
MIKPICDVKKCQKELDEKGALLFSPPAKSINRVFDLNDEIDVTRKFHICKECYYDIISNYMEG